MTEATAYVPDELTAQLLTELACINSVNLYERQRICHEAAGTIKALARDREAAMRTQRLASLASLAGDLWSQLENCRDYWQTQEFGSLCQMYISEYEQLSATTFFGVEAKEQQ